MNDNKIKRIVLSKLHEIRESRKSLLVKSFIPLAVPKNCLCAKKNRENFLGKQKIIFTLACSNHKPKSDLTETLIKFYTRLSIAKSSQNLFSPHFCAKKSSQNFLMSFCKTFSAGFISLLSLWGFRFFDESFYRIFINWQIFCSLKRFFLSGEITGKFRCFSVTHFHRDHIYKFAFFNNLQINYSLRPRFSEDLFLSFIFRENRLWKVCNQPTENHSTLNVLINKDSW